MLPRRNDEPIKRRTFTDFRELVCAFGGREIVVVFRGYFDDAGKLSDPKSVSLVIGGFIGTMDRWESLFSQWQPVLDRHGLSYFNGKECEHGNGEFSKYKDDKWKTPQNRWDVRLELASVIVESGLVGFVSGVVAADFKALTPSEKKRIGKPFSLAAQTLVVIAKDWANHNRVYERFPYLFEAGSEGYGEFSEVFNQIMKHEIRRNAYRMESCGLVGKECIGAQAADLIASEYSHCLNSIATATDSGFKRPAVQELRKLKLETKYHNSGTLAEMLAQPNSDYKPFRASRKDAISSNQ